MAAVRVRMNMLSDAETYNAFFTFEYSDTKYVVWQDVHYSENDFSWCELRWNAWSGTYSTYEDCPEDVDAIVKIIIGRSKHGDKKFPLAGEHYVVRKCASGYMISRSKKCPYRSFWRQGVPLFLRLIAGLAFALLYALIYFNTSGVMWVRTVLPSLERGTLTGVMWCTEIIGMLAFIVIGKFRMDLLDLYFASLIPLNIFTFIGALKSSLTVRRIILVLAVILALLFVVPKIFAFMREKRPGLKREKLGRAVKSAVILGCVCIFACLVLVGGFGVSGVAYQSDDNHGADGEKIYGQYIKACDLISEEKWGTLEEQEKVDVLQCISDYECVFILGCKTVNVQAGYLKNDYVRGEYTHAQKTITINEKHLRKSTVEEVLKTLLHETRHAWQHTISDMYNEIEDELSDEYKTLSFFRTAESIRDNFDSYNSGSGDFEEYYTQTVEVDSNDWAEYEFVRYRRYIYQNY